MSMKIPLLTLFAVLLLTSCERSQPLPATASVAMECEAYRAENGQKVDWTKFTVTFVPEKDCLLLRKTSGPDWIVPDKTELRLLWRSPDGLRFVAEWIDDRYGKDQKVWSPLIILDFDFGRLRYSAKTAGGFADFDKVISDPWQQECRRLN
jgi:hypothetical protein